MSFDKNYFIRYWHTIKNLKFSQIIWRLYYLFYRPSIRQNSWPVPVADKISFEPTIQKKRSYIGGGNFVFLSRLLNIKETGWNSSEYPKLWLYNLNYFDFLMQELSAPEKFEVSELVADWIKKNDIGHGIAWEPYPTSLRIVNLIKWITFRNIVSKRLEESLAQQARYLIKKIEWHIEGNHLLANAKALIFAGIFFQGPEAKQWKEKGTEILFKEIDKQILKDGAHFELSPMYHAIILEDILDIINLYISFEQSPEKIDDLRLVAASMFRWLSYLTHPDGKISHFNDASMESVCCLNDLLQYAQRLKVDTKFILSTQCDLTESGFSVSRLGVSSLITDLGEVGPKFQPGHGHADTLSFELSVFGRRVLVNSGISTYEKGLLRLNQRGTSSHNTIEINKKDSSEVWASFRVGRRAKIIERNIDFGVNQSVIKASHSGYMYLKGKPVHKREFHHSDKNLQIVDKIAGCFKSAVGRLHIHPDVKSTHIAGDQVIIKLEESKSLTINFNGCSWSIVKYLFCFDFGKQMEGDCIEYSINDDEATVLIEWNNR